MIRVMTIEDYDEVYALWKKIRGFGIRSIDDSREGGILRPVGLLRRMAGVSEASFADMSEDGAVSIMYAWMRIIVDMGLARQW